MDEFTQECQALEVGRSFKAVDVLDVLCELFVVRAVPEHTRNDNGKLCKPGIPVVGIGVLPIGGSNFPSLRRPGDETACDRPRQIQECGLFVLR